MKRPPTVRTRAEKAAINGAAEQEAGVYSLMKVNGVRVCRRGGYWGLCSFGLYVEFSLHWERFRLIKTSTT